MAGTDDKPRKLPRKFRASADPKDIAGFMRLQQNDEQQRELGERVNSPFTATSPREMARSKAHVTIDALTTASAEAELVPDQVEQLAEAYATIGAYDVAAVISQKNAELYKKYWQAVWLKDDKWCAHPERHKYIKEYVFSVKEGKEMPMLACNECDTWNVLDAPDSLTQREANQKEIHGATRGMSIEDAKAWHRRHFTK